MEECDGNGGFCFDLQIRFLCYSQISLLPEENRFSLAEMKNQEQKKMMKKMKKKNISLSLHELVLKDGSVSRGLEEER